MPNATGCPDSPLAAQDDPAGYPKYGMWEERRDYWGRHWQVHRWRGRARNHDCASCAEDGTRKRARDWAQIHGQDGEDPWTDYVTLCRSCHIRYDKSGHRQPHTEEARAKISASKRRLYAEGELVGKNTYQSGKTHCRNGHEYNDENTYLNPKGERVCRICRYDNLMRWKAKKRAAAA